MSRYPQTNREITLLYSALLGHQAYEGDNPVTYFERHDSCFKILIQARQQAQQKMLEFAEKDKAQHQKMGKEATTLERELLPFVESKPPADAETFWNKVAKVYKKVLDAKTPEVKAELTSCGLNMDKPNIKIFEDIAYSCMMRMYVVQYFYDKCSDSVTSSTPNYGASVATAIAAPSSDTPQLRAAGVSWATATSTATNNRNNSEAQSRGL